MTSRRIWLRITDCRNIPVREGRSVEIGGREVAIFNLGDRFLAVENHCPHRGGPLADGILSGTTVVCPLHAWKVNLETGRVAASGGAWSCLKKFDVRVQDGCILLAVPLGPTTAAEGLVPEGNPECSYSWPSAELLGVDQSKAGNAEI